MSSSASSGLLRVGNPIDRRNGHRGNVDLVRLVEVERVGRTRARGETSPDPDLACRRRTPLAASRNSSSGSQTINDERAGGVRIPPPLAAACDILRINDGGRRRSQFHQERCPRLLERESRPSCRRWPGRRRAVRLTLRESAHLRQQYPPDTRDPRARHRLLRRFAG